MSGLRVAVLGCGPAGLLAAHAAAEIGAEVAIYSKHQQSRIGGAQYLHCAIPGVTEDDPDGYLQLVKIGTPEGYAEKVYGDSTADTSWLRYESGVTDIWSMREAYGRLWEAYGPQVLDCEIDSKWIESILSTGYYHLIVSSIDARALCYDSRHDFTHQQVEIDMTLDNSRPWKDICSFENFIVMNGYGDERWYRTSMIFGVGGTEVSPSLFRPHQAEKSDLVVKKPLATNCDCWGDVMRVGRFGQWRKRALAHEAYFETKRAIDEML